MPPPQKLVIHDNHPRPRLTPIMGEICGLIEHRTLLRVDALDQGDYKIRCIVGKKTDVAAFHWRFLRAVVTPSK